MIGGYEMLWKLIVISLFITVFIFCPCAAIMLDIVNPFKNRNKSEEIDKHTEEAVHAKTDWYHIAYGKVRGFDYNMATTMFKIHHAIFDAKTEKYDRFYTVYCKEISDVYDSAKNMTTQKSKSEALHKISETYNIIFDTMLANITKEVERENDISADIKGVKNFAELNGDYVSSKSPKPKRKSKKETVDYRALLLDKLDNYTEQTGYILTYYGYNLRDLVEAVPVVDKDVYDKFCVIATRTTFSNRIDYGLVYDKEIERSCFEALMNSPLFGEIDYEKEQIY